MKSQKENFKMETQIIQTTELVLKSKKEKSSATRIVSTNGLEQTILEFQNVKISRTTKNGEIVSGAAVIDGEKYSFEINDTNRNSSEIVESLKQLSLLFGTTEAVSLENLLSIVQKHKSLSTPETLSGQNFTLSREAKFLADDSPAKSVVRFISSSADPETIYTIGENFVSNLHTARGIDCFVTYNGKEYDLPAEKIARSRFSSRDYKTKEIHLKATRLQKSLEFLKRILNGELSMEEALANRTSKPSSASQPNN